MWGSQHENTPFKVFFKSLINLGKLQTLSSILELTIVFSAMFKAPRTGQSHMEGACTAGYGGYMAPQYGAVWPACAAI